MLGSKDNDISHTGNDKIDNSAKKEPKIGLALGGGVARGFAHIGVIRALLRHGIKPTIVAGTSIGALVGGCYLAGKLDDLEEWGLSLSRLRVLSYLDLKVNSAGVIGGKKLQRLMKARLGNDIDIEELPYPFATVATDLVTGHEVWITKGNLIEAMTASFSLPGLFPPVERNDRFLIDGALVNPVPVSICQAMGARMTIAVDLNADMIGKATTPGEKVPRVAGYDLLDSDNGIPDKKQNLFKSIPMTKKLFARSDKDHPSMFGVMVSTLNIVQDRLTRSRLAGDPPDVHIKPHVGHIGLMEFDRAAELIKEGEAAVERILTEIIAAKNVLLPGDDKDEF